MGGWGFSGAAQDHLPHRRAAADRSASRTLHDDGCPSAMTLFSGEVDSFHPQAIFSQSSATINKCHDDQAGMPVWVLVTYRT